MVLERLPPAAASWLGRRLGDLAHVALRRRRRIGLDNLAVAFPLLSAAERRRLCRRSWQHLGTMAVELCAALTRPPERILETIAIDGLQHLQVVMETHGRALVLTAHLGNWELLVVAHRLSGYSLAIVVRPLDARWLNALADRLRRKSGVELIDKRGALRPVLESLRRGGMVAILLDQNAARHEGVFVPFFGRPASTSRSLAVLAVRTGTPIVPIFIRREAAGRHRVIIRPPLPPPSTGEPDRAISELTGLCTEAIEAAVKDTPAQWLWIHERWRTRPADERRTR